MRRWILPLLTLLLVLSVGFAAADSLPVFALVDAPQADARILGTAVLTDAGGMQLTTVGVCLPDNGQAYLRVGPYYLQAEWHKDYNDLAVLQLVQPISGHAFTFSDAEPVTYLGVTSSGAMVTGPVTLATAANDLGYSTARLTADLLPGTVLLDAGNHISGMVTAAMNEGVDRYLILNGAACAAQTGVSPADASSTEELAPALTIGESENPGIIEITWDDPEMSAFLILDANNYLTYLGSSPAYMYVVPGMEYHIWLMREDEELMDENDYVHHPYVDFAVPAEQISMHGFAITESYVTISDYDEVFGDTQIIPPVDCITVDDLLGGKSLYLQALTTYEIDHEEDYLMVAMLTMPNGHRYTTYSGFLFAPDYLPNDNWHWELTSLLEEAARLNPDDLQPGTYRLSYSIAGKAADTISFEVTESIPAAQPEQFTLEGPCSLAVDWSGLGQADTWRLFYQLEGNTLYQWMDVTESHATLAVVPGVPYAFAVAPFEGGREPELTNAVFLGSFTAEDAGRYTDHDFKEVATYVTLADPLVYDFTDIGPLEPQAELTRTALEEGMHLYLQIISAYDVQDESEVSSLFVLKMPNGELYALESGYIFSPEYMAKDSWYVDLTSFYGLDSSAFAAYLELPGTFTVSYYIDGRLAQECSFELK